MAAGAGGAALLGGLVPALGALFKRMGALKDAPAPRSAEPPRTAEPPRPSEEPIPNLRPPESEPVVANTETARPTSATAANPAISAMPAKAANPDAVRVVGLDGSPAEAGYVASERGLPQRFESKAKAEGWVSVNSAKLSPDDPARLQIVAVPHPSGEGFAVAVRRAPSAGDQAPPAVALPDAKTNKMPKQGEEGLGDSGQQSNAYRIYLLGLSGRIIASNDIKAPNDSRAEAMAVEWALSRGSENCTRFEIWQGARMLMTEKVDSN